MPIPAVDREAILRAMNKFDVELRSSEFLNWESSDAQLWAIEFEGKLYPPKKILSLAAGVPVGSFSGGPESNKYLDERGIKVKRLREASLRAAFSDILEQYPELRRTQQFGGNVQARTIFERARDVIQGWIDPVKHQHLQVVSSYGKGSWATIPWISILDKRETRSTQRGTYIVYLFSEQGDGIYLKLAQGVTEVEDEFGARAPEVLLERAARIRPQLVELGSQGWNLSGESNLGSSARLAKLYEASTIVSKHYASDAISSDGELQTDLETLLDKYKFYVDEKTSREGETIDSRRLSLIGTWRSVDQDLPHVRMIIDRDGGWAGWWSFPIREEAAARLQAPFNLYAYEGDRKVAARLRVDEFRTSNGNAGLESPWPALTDADLVGKRKLSDRQSEIFKTWVRVGAVERLVPPRSTDDFEVAVGLSTSKSLLNQNSFGYVIEDEPAVAKSPLASADLGLNLPQRADLSALAAKSGLRLELLCEIQEALLGSSPQVLLAGPPGTSKTWIARELALHLTANQAELVRFVQFHPSYSYESFIEGLRPVTKGDRVTFDLTPGLVVDTVNEMRRKKLADRPDVDYVIVMDEVNRANLPRVLGELMFAFEYRDQSVRLQYSGEFALPTNLRFIGTMNTADRSIRSIDVALRRRFEIFEFRPDPEILERYHLQKYGAIDQKLTRGFIDLNAKLTESLDRHHTIGHAFFMQSNWSETSLFRVWQRRVYPLIEEFLFDQPDLLSEFSFKRFWPSA